MAYSAGDFQEAVYLMSQGKYPFIAQMVTARLSLEQTDEAFQALLNQKDRHLKILITPKESNLTSATA
ncbi:hypothetical protein N7490_008085 [Penicillium lividum]|nr:hypothetical protein N7490_008085 [Penicillium lividum]